MAQQTFVIPANTTLKYAHKGGNDFVLIPLGETNFTTPVQATPDYFHDQTFTVEMEIDVNNAIKLTDSSNPPKFFFKYLGGRPTGR